MRFWAAVLALAAFEASAFDADAWHAVRAVHAAEAARLRAAYSNCVAQLGRSAEDITIPIETHPDGSVRFVIQAKRAQLFLDTGFVWAENVVAKQFAADGSLDTRIDARACVLDRHSRSGWAEGAARVRHGKTSLSGRGVYFSSPESYVRVYAASDLQSEDAGGERKLPFGRDGAAKGSVRIQSETSDYDRQAGVVLFERGVHVDYAAAYAMDADRIYAFLSGSNEMSRVVAVGAVSVTNGTRAGSCATAVYRRRRGEIEMFGGDGAPARLVETGDGMSEVVGDRIRFWLDAEQVEVMNSALTTERGAGKGGVPWATL